MIALTPEEAENMNRRNKITAIKLVRERTGLDLKGAKDFVERWDGRTVLPEPSKAKPCPHCGGTGFAV